MPPPNMQFWHKVYCDLKAMETKQVPGKLSDNPVLASQQVPPLLYWREALIPTRLEVAPEEPAGGTLLTSFLSHCFLPSRPLETQGPFPVFHLPENVLLC